MFFFVDKTIISVAVETSKENLQINDIRASWNSGNNPESSELEVLSHRRF